MLLGEPSPSLAKINHMNMAQLEAKIESLVKDQPPLIAKIAKLEARDPQPTEEIEATKLMLERLKTLEKLARERLAAKAERKAAYERGERRGR